MKFSTLARWTCAAVLGTAVVTGEVSLPTSQLDGNPVFTVGESVQAKRQGTRRGGGSIRRESANRPTSRSTQRPRNAGTLTTSPTTEWNRDHRTVTTSSTTDTASSWEVFLILTLCLGGMTIKGLYRLIIAFDRIRPFLPISQALTSQAEIDNDIVTVSTLRIALHADGLTLIPEQLRELSGSENLDQPQALAQSLQAIGLFLLQIPELWCYAQGDSQTLNIRESATTYFNARSLEERSHFAADLAVPTDGNPAGLSMQTPIDRSGGAIAVASPIAPPALSTPAGQYVMVTLIVATVADAPLFSDARSREELGAALVALSATPAEHLLRAEFLWTPKSSQEALTQDELLVEYPHLHLMV